MPPIIRALAAALTLTFLWMCYNVSQMNALVVADELHDTRKHHRKMAPNALQGQFVALTLDAPMPSKAASGLAVFADSTQKTHILAVANFYGASTAYSIDTRRSGLAPSKLQEFNTKAAHDFEAAHVTTSAGLALLWRGQRLSVHSSAALPQQQTHRMLPRHLRHPSV